MKKARSGYNQAGRSLGKNETAFALVAEKKSSKNYKTNPILPMIMGAFLNVVSRKFLQEQRARFGRSAPFPLGKGVRGIGRERSAKRFPAWHENSARALAIFVPRGKRSGHFSFAHAPSPSPPSLKWKGEQIIAFLKLSAGRHTSGVLRRRKNGPRTRRSNRLARGLDNGYIIEGPP